MGVGLSALGVNMNRLPGWDKNSYGYHGDDGHSFRSSGTGQQYGPTFTTNDVIGCGINLVDGSCFYTKNGHHLGVAFKDLPSQLYPTVGLQTPGEVIDANFGQEPFKFDVEGEMRELRRKTQGVIEDLSWPRRHGDAQSVLHNMVATYLVHHGYSQTAESFAKSAGQEISEELTSMRNRQHIQKLVLAGKLGDAITTVEELYPGLLHLHQDLHFKLKVLSEVSMLSYQFFDSQVRQFIEMVSGADSLDTETNMYGGRGADSSSEDMEEALDNDHSANGNTSRNGNVEDGNTPEGETPSESMEVEPAQRGTSILSNPARFDALIRFLSLQRSFIQHLPSLHRYGQGLQQFSVQLEQEKGRNEANTTMLQVANDPTSFLSRQFDLIGCAGGVQLAGVCRPLEFSGWNSAGAVGQRTCLCRSQFGHTW